MDRPVRNRKTVDYSKFDNDDEDFTCAAAPPSKKSRVTETKKEKKKPSKKSQKEETVSAHQPHVERLSVNEKLYQRDLKVAVVLSLQHGPSETPAVQASPETGSEKCASSEAEGIDDIPLLSNCSVDSSLLGLDKITDIEDDHAGGHKRREAASRAISEQRKLLMDENSEEEEEPDSIAILLDEASESESSFGDEDTDFSLKRGKKAKENKKKDGRLKVKAENGKKKSSRCRMNATVTPIATAPLSTEAKSLPCQKETHVSPEEVGEPLQALSPPASIRKPVWTPPALSGNNSTSLGGVSVKSPNQGLRLGLSRLARVKPLHPNAASS